MGKKSVWAVTVFAAFLIAAGFIWYRPTEKAEPDSPAKPAAFAKYSFHPVQPAVDLDQYVGSAMCAKCHASIAERYALSGMARSWRAIDGPPAGDFRSKNIVDDSKSGFRYQLLLEHGQVFQQETALADGEQHQLRVQAHYTIGSGNHAQAMINDHRGYLTVLPVGWFGTEVGWKLNPGYELYNHRFDRRVSPGCVACHGPMARQDDATRNRYQVPLADGISCERCHGPGKKHVDAWQSAQIDADGSRSNTPGNGESIVHPGKLSAARANDVCLQCHLQGDAVVYQPGKHAFSFRPGDKLADHRLDFIAKTEQPEAFGVASHGARMMRSPCYQKSAGKLTCIHCHDPHEPTRDVPAAFFDARCIDCHKPAACGREVPAGSTKNAEGCVRCHMLRRNTREGQHLVFTDHWIQKRPKADSDVKPLSADADVELAAIWPEADPHQLRLGTAYIKLHETMGPQTVSLRRGRLLLENAKRQGHADGESMVALGSGLIALRQGNDAADLLQSVVNQHPDYRKARFRLAVAYDQAKQYDQAIAEYKKVLKSAPQGMMVYPLLARLLLFKNETGEAISLLEKQREYAPDAVTFAQLALARHLQGEPTSKCLKLVDEALQRDPRYVRAYLYQAHFHAVAGDAQAARISYLRALKIEPGNQLAHSGLRGLDAANRKKN